MSLYSSYIKGNGPPLLMLHGWGQTHENLRPLAEHLASVSEPHLLDIPGFGKSEIPNSTWSAFDYADEMIRYLDSQNIEKVSLLGHSFGGKIAMCMAIRFPQRIDRLVLLSPSGLLRKRTIFQKIRFKSIYAAGKLIKCYDRMVGTAHYPNMFIPRYGSRDYKNAGEMRHILVRSVNEDLTTMIPQIQCSTLILWGGRDRETPDEMGHRLCRLIPNGKLVLFPYHGHEIFHDVGSHLCATYIRPFFTASLLEGR